MIVAAPCPPSGGWPWDPWEQPRTIEFPPDPWRWPPAPPAPQPYQPHFPHPPGDILWDDPYTYV